jgi:chemotaxis protein histidine kinase CheA
MWDKLKDAENELRLESRTNDNELTNKNAELQQEEDNAVKEAKNTLEEAKKEAEAAKGEGLRDALDKLKEVEVEAASADADEKPAAQQKLKEAKDKYNDEKKAADEKFKAAVAEADQKFKATKDEAANKKKEAVAKAKDETSAGNGKLKGKVDEAKATHEKSVADEKAAKEELLTTTKDYRKVSAKIDGSATVFEKMIEALVKINTDKAMEHAEPAVSDMFTKGFRWVRQLLGLVVKALTAVVGSIPFVGGVLAVALQVAYDIGMDLLEQLCLEKLIEFVRRIFSKKVRDRLGDLTKSLQDKVLSLVSADFKQEYPNPYPDDGQLLLAAFAPDKLWILRALACRRAPLIDAKMEEEAIAARFRILNRAREMYENAPMYARAFADRYFRRFGLTYNQWMAAVATDAHPVMVARAQAIEKRIREDLKRLQVQVPERAGR